MDNDTRRAREFVLDAREGSITGPGGTVRLEPKVMAVLAVLAENPGHVVFRDELLDAVWPGTVVTEHTLTRCIYQLRHELRRIGPEPEETDYNPIETLPKRGYRLLATVKTLTTEDAASPDETTSKLQHRFARGVVIFIVMVVAAVMFYLLYPRELYTTEEISPVDASIAVLPFDNRSPNPDNAYFADGIHDDLLMLLSRLGDLKVVSRTSVEAFRDSTNTVPEIGQALGVEHVLEGAVQRVEDRVRISVQLINVAEDDHVWAESYDRQLTATDIFAIQSDVAEAIASALQATLSLHEQQRLRAVPTDDLAAYEAYLLGKQSLARRSSTSVAMATNFFERAVALDPEFALAFVGLADSLNMQIVYSGAPKDPMNAKAEAAIARALELDDRLGEAYTSLGWLRQFRDDFDGAETAFQRALQLAPSYVATFHWYGNLLLRLGRTQEALVHHLKAVELDPVSADMNLHVGHDLESLGRFDEALTQYQKTIEIDPSFAITYATIADVYWLVDGDLVEAMRWYRKALNLDPSNPVTPAWLGRLYLDLQDVEMAEHWIQRSFELGPESFDGNYAMAMLNLARGDEEQALYYATKVMEISPRWNSSVTALLRNHDLQANRVLEARARYEELYPRLFSQADPVIGRTNYAAAIDLAFVLMMTGDNDRAQRLLALSLDVVEATPRLGIQGHGISEARIIALQGRTGPALAALRQAIDNGWRHEWWYHLEHDPTLETIRGESEFLAMIEDVQSDMAAQLTRISALEPVD